jgi:prepilin-type N-terminal cleavage/methylation domain-containing protein
MKKAFTLMELIFVIIVIGVLTAVMTTNTGNDSLTQAAHQVAADIRYTQHLAMIDDKYDRSEIDSENKVKWQKSRWQIYFSDNETGADGQWAYTIFSDTNGDSTGEPTETEIAIDPNSHRRMTGGQTGSNSLKITKENFVGEKRLNIGKTYGVSNVTFSDSCTYYNSKRLAFDYTGRPLLGNISSMSKPYDATHLLSADCDITLIHSNGDSIVITVQAETGYVKVTY